MDGLWIEWLTAAKRSGRERVDPGRLKGDPTVQKCLNTKLAEEPQLEIRCRAENFAFSALCDSDFKGLWTKMTQECDTGKI